MKRRWIAMLAPCLLLVACLREPLKPDQGHPQFLFSAGDTIELVSDAPVRAAPNAFAGSLGTQLKGARGKILSAPGTVDTEGDNTRYWNIDFFSTTPDGWVSGIYLMPSGASIPTFYVSPTGSTSNDGSSPSQAWPLQHALAGAPDPSTGSPRIHAGDLIYLLDGNYDMIPNTAFEPTSAVNGTSSRRTTFRAAPGAHPVLRLNVADCIPNAASLLHVGPAVAWVTFQDLELVNIATSRLDPDPTHTGGSDCSDYRRAGIFNEGDNIAFVSLLLHDLGTAVFNGANADGAEFDGNVIFNNGWQKANGATSGHGLYLHSSTGVTARGNVIFNQYGYGIHGFSSTANTINNVTLSGNVSFNNGTLGPQASTCATNILLGGETPSTGDVVTGNMTYFGAPERTGMCQNVRIGWGNDAILNGTVEVSNNYFVGKGVFGSPWDLVFLMSHWTSATVTNNTFIGCKPGGSCAGTLVGTRHCSTSGPLGTIWSWTGNKQYRDPASGSWEYFVSPACTTYSQQQTFTTWRDGTQLGLSDQTFSSAPTSQQVFSWGSSFDPNRAIVVVYNWTLAGDFTVDLTGKLAAGTYRVFNVMNLSAPVGSPVTYSGSGSITLPISLVTPTNPIGTPFDPPFADDIKFNVYLLRP
jgi:parallel beta-helix repeat protein